MSRSRGAKNSYEPRLLKLVPSMAIVLSAMMALSAIVVLGSGSPLLMTGGSGASVPVATSSNDPTITSYNWAGYSATSTVAGNSVALVNAEWLEPSVTCTTLQPVTVASIWAGIDGFPAGSPTVEAAGTAAVCSLGIPSHIAWYEIYPAPPVVVFTSIHAGDLIQVQVIHPVFPPPPTLVVFVIQDLTANIAYSTTILLPAGTPLRSADCVVQRVTSISGPMEYASPAMTTGPAPPFFAFTHFGAFAFKDCIAQIGSSVGGIATLPPAVAAVYRISVTMVGLTLFAKTSVATGPGSTFMVTWQHF